jgi:hypothetical protein
MEVGKHYQDHMFATRVPGGWVYREGKAPGTFVPYNPEFRFADREKKRREVVYLPPLQLRRPPVLSVPCGAGRLGHALGGCSPGWAARGVRADARRGHQREQSGMG